jgi:hypothetical protein
MCSVGAVDGCIEVPDAIKSLVASHREIKEEPLHLAIFLRDPARPAELVLLEVLGNFGQDQISDEGEIMTVRFPSSADLPIGSDRELCLMLTNVPEFETASASNWASILEVRRLIGEEAYSVVSSDDVGKRLLQELTK